MANVLKFSQNNLYRQHLLDTQEIIIEAAPADGSFGVAMNANDFLTQSVFRPESFDIQSTDQSMLTFTIEAGKFKGTEVKREARLANSLGKSLQLVKDILSVHDAIVVTLDEAFALSYQAMRNRGAFDQLDDIASSVRCLM